MTRIPRRLFLCSFPALLLLALVQSCSAATERTILVEDTFGWGCPCPPYVDPASGGDDASEYEFLYPFFAPEVRDISWPPTNGRYRLTGRYTGEFIDRYEWVRRRGERSPGRGDGVEYYVKSHPVFEVSGWCVVSWEQIDEPCPDCEEPPTEERPFADTEICPR